MSHALLLLSLAFAGVDYSAALIPERGGDQVYSALASSPRSGAIGPLSNQVAPESSNPAIAPTSHDAIQFALSMYRGVRPEHTFVDIGCGDGRVLIAAVQKFKCYGLGIEIAPDQAELARRCVEAAGLSSKILIVEGDATSPEIIREIEQADAGFAYLYPETLEALTDVIAGIPAFVSYQHPVAGLLETRSQHGKFYSKHPLHAVQKVQTAQTKVVPAAPYAVWNGRVHTREWNANCNCAMCRSIRHDLTIPRTTTVVVQPEQQVKAPQIEVKPQKTGSFQWRCVNGRCGWYWVE